jgi:hypothetical protein
MRFDYLQLFPLKGGGGDAKADINGFRQHSILNLVFERECYRFSLLLHRMCIY